jgi:phosphoribosylformimino-5-aminoimidazole carboxamide ribotide isomerase
MPMTFEVLPAIDLRDGRVVRLVEGDFGRETAFGDDPVAVAESFVTAGARTLHIVDLDAARLGRPTQVAQIHQVIARVGALARVELAGGLRTSRDVADALEGGAVRAVVGTAALGAPEFARALVDVHGADRIVVALDVRNGEAVGEGWRKGARGWNPEEVLQRLADAGVRTFEVTAIERDGRLDGPDLALLERLVGLGRGDVIASGGIRSVPDLEAARSVGCAGAIVGRAIYEGRLDLAAAIARFSGPAAE